MKRLDSMLLKLFLRGIPLVVLLATFTYFYNAGTISHESSHAKSINIFAGVVFATWMVLSIYLSIRLIASATFRDQVLAKITLIREDDEREMMLTGKATKTTFLTSLAILILLLCLSCFQISVYRVPQEKAVDGKTGFISLGFNFNCWKTQKQMQRKIQIKGNKYSCIMVCRYPLQRSSCY